MRVGSKRGWVKAKALVMKRIKPLPIDGKPMHVVGVPLAYGCSGAEPAWFDRGGCAAVSLPRAIASGACAAKSSRASRALQSQVSNTLKEIPATCAPFMAPSEWRLAGIHLCRNRDQPSPHFRMSAFRSD